VQNLKKLERSEQRVEERFLTPETPFGMTARDSINPIPIPPPYRGHGPYRSEWVKKKELRERRSNRRARGKAGSYTEGTEAGHGVHKEARRMLEQKEGKGNCPDGAGINADAECAE
jgi:hypothetical protein